VSILRPVSKKSDEDFVRKVSKSKLIPDFQHVTKKSSKKIRSILKKNSLKGDDLPSRNKNFIIEEEKEEIDIVDEMLKELD